MQENNKLIAQALLDIAKNSETTFLEVGKEDKELIEAAKKLGIELPSPDLMVMKTVYAEIDKVNLNGVILPKKAVKEGLNTLIGKQCNWEHNGSGFVCGYTISAKINDNKIETINVLFKSLFSEQADELKEKVKSGEAAVSFEIWNRDPETGKSVVKELDNGFKEISPIIFHGTGVLLSHKPACPTAKIFKLIGKKLTEAAEKVMNQVFAPDLIYASLALEDTEESSYECECLKCGNVISSNGHCKDIKCPKCGGDMRRKDRPGAGQPTTKSNEVKVIIKQIESKEWICPHCEKAIGEKELFYDEKNQKWYHRPCQEKGEIILPKENNKKEENIVELEKLFANVIKEEDITFEIAMAFYYSSDEEKAKLTEDAAKWTRKFINSLPDSAFAVIEPAYPEKTEDKNCRHLPHHNGEGDLGKEKSNANLDLPHYKNALARVNQINPVTDSISAEDLRARASAHLERHKDALEKSSEGTQAEVKPEETKPVDAGAETKSEETKAEVTSEGKAQEMQVNEPKIIVKTTSIYSEVRIDTYIDGTPSGTQEVKGYSKKITEYKDGTKDEVEEEVTIEKKFTFAEVEEKVNTAKAEKDAEIAALKLEHEKVLGEKDKEIVNIKTELGKKDQEIAELKTPKVEPEKDLTVGAVEGERQSELKQQADNINKIIAEKHNQ